LSSKLDTGWFVNASAIDPTQYGNIQCVASSLPLHPLTHLTSYVNESVARATGLLAINGAQNFILKVDNATNDPAPGRYSTFGRNSVMIETNYTIDIGTLVVLDAVHIPYGVRVRAPRYVCAC
jgi:hypothetical protein